MKRLLIKLLSYAVLILVIVFMSIRIKDLNKSLDRSVNNEKAYAAENSKLNESNIVFKFELAQMQHMNDSILVKMLETSRSLNIKDKKIESLQYQLEHIGKRDTLRLTDTIFVKNFALDTCLVDNWSKTCLHLKYPGEIGISSEFNNEKYIITSWRKEPIKQRTWFLPRWFTRKQKIITVDVVDKNPYVTTERQRFVQIVK